MRLLRAAVLAVAAVALVLTPLLLLDGAQRTGGFRFAVLLLAGFALRSISTATADANPVPPDSPFRRERRRTTWRLRRRTPARRSPADSLMIGSIERDGPFHFRLRPALRDIADERLRAHHGIGVDDPAAADHLGPEVLALLRTDRPPPRDRRAPGPDEATMERMLAAIERI